MSFCIICSLCRLHFSQQMNPGQQLPLPSELAKDLADLRKFSLNLLVALVAVLAFSGSKVLLPMVLALLIYTVNLRFVVNTCFLEDYATLSRMLHAVPPLGVSCIASIELVSGVQSPALAAVLLFLSVSPLVTTIVHHGRRCMQPATVVLPIRMWDPSTDMPAVPN